MNYPNILSIHKTAERCKAEGIPLPEKAIRRFVKNGSLPAIQSGTKSLIYFPNVIKLVEHGNDAFIVDPPCGTGGIRKMAE